MIRVVTLVSLFTVVNISEAARILTVIPTPSISHQIVFRPLMKELAKRGHDVIVVTTDPEFPKGEAPANLTEIDVHFSYKEWRASFLAATSSAKKSPLDIILVSFRLIRKLFGEQMQIPEVQAILNNKNKPVDLVLCESILRACVSLGHVLNAPVIQISSLGPYIGDYETIGAPVHPILYPQFFRCKIYNLSFWDKLKELYQHYQFVKYVTTTAEDAENEVIKKTFGPDVPPLRELLNNVHMLFLNINPIFEGNHPVPPGVIYMGGLHQNPIKELPQDLKEYLDASTNGIIYMSFGTNVSPSQLPPEAIKTLLKVFSKVPYNIMWKWDQDTLPGKPDNVKIFKWVPQSDLLRHPNIKLFITQAGLQSTDEAITAGVPMIGIPMLADQWYNADKYEYHKIGLRIDITTLTEERLLNGINKIIGDKSYYENVRRLHKLMIDQPMQPLERAVWWLEYAIRHKGAKHLRAPAANITWAEYLELEFVATLLLLVLAVLFSFYFIYRFLKSFILAVKLKTS